MKLIKTSLKYIVIIGIALLLLKNSYKGFELQEIMKGLKQSKPLWIVLALISNILSHVFRAMRWGLLLNALNYFPKLFSLLISDLIGPFVNLLLPRIGEIFRCTALKRVERIPITTSLSTIIVERSLDVIVFGLIVLGSFFIFSSKMLSVLSHIHLYNLLPSKKYVLIGLSSLLCVAIMTYLLRSKLKKIIIKVVDIILDAWQSLLDIFKHGSMFMILLQSFLIWFFYFLSVYLVFFSINATSDLKLDAGIIVLIASSLGLSAPVQGGGAGALHKLVIIALSLYNISRLDSVIAATLIHGVQFFSALVFGGVSFILSLLFRKNESK